ncbi:MAG: NADH-quinone oxidoreductase subunit L [Deltaproteobacteria bacterium]|nr:NADH-quinone oxidoreductase subunit L [Deltaproteobacteria bacterium]
MEHGSETTRVVEATWLFMIPLFPLLGAAVNAVFGKKLQDRFGKGVVHAVALGAVFSSLAFALAAVWQILAADGPIVLVDRLWTWIAFRWHGVALNVPFQLAADRLTAVMLFVVTFVGSLIHVFSTGYMQDEKPYWRFFAWLNLFMFAMLVLVLGDSFLTMFVGWEGVGLCSYLLISYYYEETDKAAAGMKAFVVNRIGDFAFIIGMGLLLWAVVGTWTEAGQFVAGGPGSAAQPTLLFRDLEALMRDAAFRDAFLAKQVFGIPVVTLVCVLFFVGAAGKSAQLPLYVWLPDAMAGPTPVSALIHAATMVTAGVYMVARLNFLYVHSPVAMTVVATVGALTAVFAATIGFFQTDLKKVLAYSTVSQLGYMFVGVGVGAFSAGVFHLMTHAFFKACLFLGSGSIIYAMHHRQDLRDMGGLRKVLPATYLTFLASTIAIAGIPGTSGFFSKDEILWRAFDNGNTLVPGWVLWAIAATAALFTAFYMTRLLLMTFFGEPRADEHTLHHAHEHKRMTIPLYVLAFLALVGGFVGVPAALGGSNRFEHFLAPVFAAGQHLTWLSAANDGHGSGLHSHAGEYVLMAFAVVLGLAGIYAAWRLYGRRYMAPEQEAATFGAGLHRVLANKYFVDEGYWRFVVNPLLATTRFLARFDKLVIDGVVNGVGFVTKLVAWINGAIDKVFVDGAVNGMADATLAIGRRVRRVETGQVQAYVVGIMGGLSVLVVVFYLVAR